MTPQKLAIVASVSLFVGMMICLEVGYRLGHRATVKRAESSHEGLGLIEAAVFALLGLLLAFTFSGGMSRVEARRRLVVQEANAIDTAYSRLDLAPAESQPTLRRLFREYLDARLRAYRKFPDLRASEQEFARAEGLQKEIWSAAVVASRGDLTQNTTRLLLPALNEMIGITAERTMARDPHLPTLIFVFLICIALLSGLLAGYAVAERRGRSWFHIVMYAVVISLTIFVLVELQFPRSSLINLEAADRVLLQLRNSIR